MADTRIQTALKDLLAGKAAVDDSRTALYDYLDSSPNLVGLPKLSAESAERNLSRAISSLNHAVNMLQFLLRQMDGAA